MFFGYLFLGLFPYKLIVLPSLVLVMIGASFIKSIITGTVAKTTSELTRARGFSIFYGMVNVGAFLGKSFAYPLRIQLGVEYINLFSAGCTAIALIVVLFFYKNVGGSGNAKKIREIWGSLIRVVKNTRLLVLIFIISGFWIIQHQLYATMPKYVLRTVGNAAAPEWLAQCKPIGSCYIRGFYNLSHEKTKRVNFYDNRYALNAVFCTLHGMQPGS